MNRDDKINKIIEINPRANREELQRLSGEHLDEVFRYWIDKGIESELRRVFKLRDGLNE